MYSMASQRQIKVLEFIQAFARKNGSGPTMREIQRHFGFRSPNAAQCHVAALRRNGHLAGRRRVWRGAEPVDKGSAICVYGTIPAGLPSDTIPEPEGTIALDESLFGLRTGSKVFALRVHGRSMAGAGINDGDLVFLVDRPPRHREIVAALIDGESTLKRFLDQPGGAVLHAENPDYKDLYPASELTIQGVMVGLFRRGGS
jgi:repressor LexA